MINYRTIARQLTLFIRQYSPLSVEEMCPITLSILCFRFAAHDRAQDTHGEVDPWGWLIRKIGEKGIEPKYLLQDTLSEAGNLFKDKEMYNLYDRVVRAAGRLPEGDFCKEYLLLIDELTKDYCVDTRRAGIFNHILQIHGGRYMETVPAEVGSLVSMLIRRFVWDRQRAVLYEPTCGVGSLGVRVFGRNASRFAGLVMREDSVLQTDMARLNLFVNSIERYDLKNEDFLRDDWMPTEHFDVIVSMPAWGLRRRIDPPLQGELPLRYPQFTELPYDYACITRGLESLKMDGMMVMAMPMGVLTQMGIGETVRREIILHKDLRAVIGMPVNMLYSTSVAFALLVFQHSERRKGVLMVNAKDLYDGHGRLNRMNLSNQQRIAQIFLGHRTVAGLSGVVEYDEIANNDFNLLPSHYVNDPTAEQRAITEKIKEINELTARMKEITLQHNEYLRQLGLPELEV